MAKIAEELFEGGADEAAVTTSNSTATVVSGTIKFDTAQSVEGTRSARVETSAARSLSYWRKNITATSSLYMRWYQRFAALPSDTATSSDHTSIATTLNASLATCGDVRVNSSTAKFQIHSAADGLGLVATSATAAVANQWYRFEWQLTTTTQTLRVFTGANLHGTTPDQTLTGAVGGTNPTRLIVGSQDDSPASWTTWLDAFAADDTTWVGPLSQPVTGTLTASLPALTTGVTGTVTWPTVTGALAATLPTPTAAATGTVTWPVRTGQLTATLPGLSAGLAGDVTWPVRTGALAGQLPALTTALVGSVAWPATTGQLAATLPTLAVGLTGDTPAAGTLAAALPRLTASVTGDIGDARAGYLTATLTAPTVTLTGHIDVTGALDAILPGLEAHLAGTGPPVTAHHVLTVGPPRPGLVVGTPRPGLVAGPPRVLVTVGSPT